MAVYHICSPALWFAANEREYCPASFGEAGFIHCSTADQLVEVANYVFRAQRGLILLVIDPARVASPIRYEDAGNRKLYPHMYGHLNPGAVVAVEPFEPNADGMFELPRHLADRAIASKHDGGMES